MTYETSTIGRAREILRITADAFSLLEYDPHTISYDAVVLLTEANRAMDWTLRYARSEWGETGRAIDAEIVTMSDTMKVIQSGHRNKIRVDRAEILRSVMMLGCTAQTVGYVCHMHLPSVSSRLVALQGSTNLGGNREVGVALAVLLDPTDVASGLVGVR